MAERELLGQPKAAAYIGVAEQTLANWRYLGKGPRYYRVGQSIRYARQDLDAFLDAGAVEPQPAA